MNNVHQMPKCGSISGADTFQSKEPVKGGGHRKQWTLEEKARIAAESFAPGADVREVARRYGITLSQIYGWRKHFLRSGAQTKIGTHDGRMSVEPDFVPIVVAEPAPVAVPTKTTTLSVTVGRMVIRIDGQIDPSVLDRVLSAVGRLA